MKYQHAHHAGNFADVHKHITLLVLLESLKRKDKGFFYLETHAGRGVYAASSEARLGIERFMATAPAAPAAPDLAHYTQTIMAFRQSHGGAHSYPGSPWLAAQALRAQDRAVLVEIVPAQARALEQAIASHSKVRVEQGDGFARLRAHLPPRERRGLLFIDPPYEETRQDFERVRTAVSEALQRFETGMIAAWYPIKDESDTATWHALFKGSLGREALVSELWLYPRDSRVGLNGSGVLIVNPPYLFAERARDWLGELHGRLDAQGAGGFSVQAL